MMKMVTVFDGETRQLHKVPEAELVAGMVSFSFVKMEGEPVLIAHRDFSVMPDLVSMMEKSIYWPPFLNSIPEVIQFIQRTFAAVDDRTVEAWDDYFRAQWNPDEDLLAKLSLAMAYAHLSDDPKVSPKQLGDIDRFVWAWKYLSRERFEQFHAPTISAKRVQEMTAKLAAWERAPVSPEYRRLTRAIHAYFDPIKRGRRLTAMDFMEDRGIP